MEEVGATKAAALPPPAYHPRNLGAEGGRRPGLHSCWAPGAGGLSVTPAGRWQTRVWPLLFLAGHRELRQPLAAEPGPGRAEPQFPGGHPERPEQGRPGSGGLLRPRSSLCPQCSLSTGDGGAEKLVPSPWPSGWPWSLLDSSGNGPRCVGSGHLGSAGDRGRWREVWSSVHHTCEDRSQSTRVTGALWWTLAREGRGPSPGHPPRARPSQAPSA